MLALAGLIPLLAVDQQPVVGITVGWLALSVGWHAIPSSGDTGNVWRAVKAHWRSSMLAALLIPVVCLLYVANLLKFLWFDAIYSLSLGAVAYYAVGLVVSLEVLL